MGTRLFDLDLQQADLEVLRSIYHASRLEIERRRNLKIVSEQEAAKALSKSSHCAPGRTWGRKKFHPKSYQRHLKPLLELDWSRLFCGSDERKFYVYAHIKPGKLKINFNKEQHGIDFVCEGVPFYIGKGCGDRAFDLKRNEGHGRVLAGLKKAGLGQSEIVRIVQSDMTEPEALELESKLIYFFGTKFEGGRTGCLVNLELPPRPEGFY